MLRKYADRGDLEKWPGPGVSMFMGKLLPEEMLAAARHDNKNRERLQLCEAYFFLGQYYLLRKDTDSARRAFEKSVGTGVKMYLEDGFSQTEIARLDGTMDNS